MFLEIKGKWKIDFSFILTIENIIANKSLGVFLSWN